MAATVFESFYDNNKHLFHYVDLGRDYQGNVILTVLSKYSTCDGEEIDDALQSLVDIASVQVQNGVHDRISIEILDVSGDNLLCLYVIERDMYGHIQITKKNVEMLMAETDM